ncbi:hypothetical protein [Nocardia tengchongensis]|uniref:hypothetical protein n=1 Tax=Nocardia tengchongensis TaxID=2055889 RepID=UPI00369C773A
MGLTVENATESAGTRLVEALSRPSDPFSLEVLIIEAGRVADRLEKLDDLLSGGAETWARVLSRRGDVVELNIDGGMVEARQQATVLRQLLAEIRRIRGDSGPDPDDDDPLDSL